MFRWGRECQGQGDSERGAYTQLTVNGDGTAQQLNQLVRQCQANARALVGSGSGWVSLIEAVENTRQVFGGNANTRILHHEPDSGFGAVGGKGNLPTRRRKLDRIAQQVRHDFLHLVGIEGRPQRMQRQGVPICHLLTLCQRLERSGQRPQQSGEVAGLYVRV